MDQVSLAEWLIGEYIRKGIFPRPAPYQGETVTEFKVGDRVRHREDDTIGEVYGVHTRTIWVLWSGGGVPQNTLPSNLIPVPFLEGDRVKSKPGQLLVPFRGEVVGVDGDKLWVRNDVGISHITIRAAYVERE